MADVENFTAGFTKQQARLAAGMSKSMIGPLLQVSERCDAEYLAAEQRGASIAELRAIAANGLEAATRLYENAVIVRDATIQARQSRWRSRARTERSVRASVEPLVRTTAAAIAAWQERARQAAND